MRDANFEAKATLAFKKVASVLRFPKFAKSRI